MGDVAAEERPESRLLGTGVDDDEIRPQLVCDFHDLLCRVAGDEEQPVEDAARRRRGPGRFDGCIALGGEPLATEVPRRPELAQARVARIDHTQEDDRAAFRSGGLESRPDDVIVVLATVERDEDRPRVPVLVLHRPCQ